MKKLMSYDLDCLAIGSAILGSGGGGDPTYDIMMAKYQMDQHGTITLLSLSELEEHHLIVPLAFIGAPLVGIERIPSGREYTEMFQVLKQHIGQATPVLMPAEIGGGNAFTPLTAACQLGLPVLDADTIGRAFPQLQMSSCYLHGISPSPTFLTDCMGHTAIVHANNSFALEKIARSIAVAMGSSCAAALYLMTSQQAKQATIPGSLSQSIEIGKVFLEAKEKRKSSIDAVLKLTGGVRLGRGKIIDIQQIVEQGFLVGNVTIQQDVEKWKVSYQNEYLIVSHNEKPIATTPDIIVLFEQDTGHPLTSESLQFGLQVEIAALPAPLLWQTAKGLSLVGPRAFGFNNDYKPIHT